MSFPEMVTPVAHEEDAATVSKAVRGARAGVTLAVSDRQ